MSRAWRRCRTAGGEKGALPEWAEGQNTREDPGACVL